MGVQREGSGSLKDARDGLWLRITKHHESGSVRREQQRGGRGTPKETYRRFLENSQRFQSDVDEGRSFVTSVKVVICQVTEDAMVGVEEHARGRTDDRVPGEGEFTEPG